MGIKGCEGRYRDPRGLGKVLSAACGFRFRRREIIDRAAEPTPLRKTGQHRAVATVVPRARQHEERFGPGPVATQRGIGSFRRPAHELERAEPPRLKGVVMGLGCLRRIGEGRRLRQGRGRPGRGLGR